MSNRRSSVTEINIIRALMIMWIFITHYYEYFNGGAYFGNPNQNWPSLSEKLQQLRPEPYNNFISVGQSIYKYLGLTGDQGVQVFILISGFVLTLSILSSSRGQVNFKTYFKKRVLRIYPAWIICHLGLVLIRAISDNETGISLFTIKTWFSMAGIRIIPSLMYYGSPAWWFIGCLLQLYILFPFIYNITVGKKRENRLILLIFLAVIIRLAGLLYLNKAAPDYLDFWSRGILFFGRLPEFTMGILLGAYFYKKQEEFTNFIKSIQGIGLSIAIWFIGNLCSFSLPGMSIAFLLTGTGVFLLLWGIILNIGSTRNGILQLFNKINYEFYLVHYLFIASFFPILFSTYNDSIGFFLLSFLFSLILSLAIYTFLRLKVVINLFDAFFIRIKWIFTMIVVFYLFAIIFELMVQRIDPDEVNGWGEKPMLQMDSELGYHLIPNETKRLRWSSYDYTVQSNNLGFPGPQYFEKKDSGVFRIIVTGDAFESAEGVDSEKSWPRLLEDNLNKKSSQSKYEVMNFSITGWGPQHYSRVLEKYVPEYHPDLVIIGLFINDLVDVFRSDEDFNIAIGFNNPMPISFHSTIKLMHLRSEIYSWYLSLASIIDPKVEPSDYGYALSNLIEKSSQSKLAEGGEIVLHHLKKIKCLETSYNTRVIAILNPSSLQAANIQDLNYLPSYADYSDTLIYDLYQPQEILMSICNNLSIPYYDVRELFAESGGKGIYQPQNMHWTEYGHQIIAEWLSDTLIVHNVSN